VADTDTPVAIGALKMGPACQYLGGIHPATMRRLIERGLIRPNKVFRHLLFPVDELNRVIKEGMIE
jgi:predicted urease superfamily metal-dependent hydrolase